MEISGKVLREVEFRDRLRGYDTDEVDEFLEQVAVAVDELLAEHVTLRQRAELAERQAQEAPPLDDDGIRRTLVLAQRTADLALREARAEAEQVLGEARARAEQMLLEAEDEAARLRDEADRDVRSRAAQVTEQHERLTREIRILGALLESERTRITQSLTDALRFVGESMSVSDDVSAAVGGRGELSEGSDLTVADLRAARAAPSGQGDGRPDAGGNRRSSGYGDHHSDRPPPPGGAGPAGSQPSRPAVPQAAPHDASTSGGTPAVRSSSVAPPAPPTALSRPIEMSPGAAASGSAATVARRSGNGATRPERDIEAELIEDAGLSRAGRGDGRPPSRGGRAGGEVADASDDDALWARWRSGGNGALDPLADPPPTQAYRLEPDGGWTA